MSKVDLPDGMYDLDCVIDFIDVYVIEGRVFTVRVDGVLIEIDDADPKRMDRVCDLPDSKFPFKGGRNG